MQIFCGGTALCGAVGLFQGLFYRLIAWFDGISVSVGRSATVGVIGGSDGPTAVFVTTPRGTGYIISSVALLAGTVGRCFLNRRKRK